MPSSSSSSHQIDAKKINKVIVNQDSNNLLPFAFIGERGHSRDMGVSDELAFTVSSSSNPYLDYEAVINQRDNSYLTTLDTAESDVYLPQDSRTKYQHKSEFYIDVISKDSSGIKNVRTHVEPNAYQFEEVEDVFYIPKFTWSDQFWTNTVTSTTTTIVSNIYDTFWTGLSSNYLYNFAYDRDYATSIYEEDVGSPVTGVVVSNETNRMYVSTNTDFIYYRVEPYIVSKDIEQELIVSNTDRGIISLYVNNLVWAVHSYEGKVTKRNANTLDMIGEYSGLDAPFKIKWSEYHNAYFIAGSYILWKLDDTTNTITTVYEINDYILLDFDISDNGKICLVLDGSTQDLIRVLDNDLYTFELNEKVTDANLKFCRYCEEGRFYILGELFTGTTIYSSSHYVFNYENGTLDKVTSEEALATTTTTTTLGTTSQAVQIEYPNGGEELERGLSYEIRWISSKSATDLVKIDLYKGGEFASVIAESTTNTGIYEWDVPSGIKRGDDYKIKMTWLSASSGNEDFSDNNFEIADNVASTTTTTTTLKALTAVGIDYDKNNDQVVILLSSGLYGMFALSKLVLYGMIESGIKEPIFITNQNVDIGQSDIQDKVRIFVGSQMYYSDKWDSGMIETGLKSMYYGGGNNLKPGTRYYVHIQVYSEDEGWSELQIKQFIMPK